MDVSINGITPQPQAKTMEQHVNYKEVEEVGGEHQYQPHGQETTVGAMYQGQQQLYRRQHPQQPQPNYPQPQQQYQQQQRSMRRESQPVQNDGGGDDSILRQSKSEPSSEFDAAFNAIMGGK